MTYGERMKACFSRLSVLAGAYLPAGFKDAMIDMAHEMDRMKAEIQTMKEKEISNG